MEEKYIIEIPHYYCLIYNENMRKMILDIDLRASKIELTTDLIHTWEKPYDQEEITEKERKRIIRNIYDYLLKKNSPERVSCKL